jgi:hypothetical protein
MTTFLWTVLILMAVALLAEIVAFAGMAIVALRAARRGAEIADKLKQAIEPSSRNVKELRQLIQAQVESITTERKAIADLVTIRSAAVRAVRDDTNRRAERIRLRLLGGAQSVDGAFSGRRGIYYEIAQPIQTAGQVMRGLKIALWILRSVA